MKLNMDALHEVVKQAASEERLVNFIRTEAKRAFGHSLRVDNGSVASVCDVINEALDVFDRTGRSGRFGLKTSVAIRLAESADPSARKLAARVLPTGIIRKLAFDKDHAVRAAVARRSNLSLVTEMLRKNPQDDELRIILREKAKEDSDKSYFGLGKEGERLGDALGGDDSQELTDTWYKSLAQKMMYDSGFGTGIERSWENQAVARYVASIKATTGIEIDQKKLKNALSDAFKEHDDRVLERDALKETADWLRKSANRIPVIEESDVDESRQLVESGLSPSAFVDSAKKLFSIKEAPLPSSLKKCIGFVSEAFVVPVFGKMPKGYIAESDERALDKFVEHWNAMQASRGEGFKLSWSPDPGDASRASFSAILR